MSIPTLNRNIVPAAQSNLAGSSVSDWVDTEYFNAVNFEIRATGTPTGTFTLEGTNQTDPGAASQPLVGVTPVTMPAAAMNPPLPAAAGAAVDYVGDLVSGVRWVRIRYTRSGGAGSLAIHVNATGA